jgi:hypothetical protein
VRSGHDVRLLLLVLLSLLSGENATSTGENLVDGKPGRALGVEGGFFWNEV